MVRRESSVCAQREAWLGIHVWRVTCVVATVLGCGGGVAGEDAPARVADAARVLDLRSAPVLEKAEFRSERNVASLSYEAPATVKEGYAFHEQSLKKDRWQVLDGGYVTDDTASSVFARDGFKVSVTVMPSGQPGTVHVSIVNHGNVDTAQLPTPARSTPFFSIPISTAYLVESSIEDARAEVLALLTAKGWQPYGQAGDVSYFKHGAVRLSARVAAAPAQAGKTFVEYSTEQMSADLPAPPNAKRLQYADATKELSFDTSASVDDVAAFYRQVLTRDGWQATTEQLVRDKFESWLIFRNPQQEMLMLTLREVDDVTRGVLRYQTAEEISPDQRDGYRQ